MDRICIVTAAHLSTCPRMLKAADALAEAGYRVRVVSARYSDWATLTDEDVRRRRRAWDWSFVDYTRLGAPRTYFRTGLRLRVSQTLARLAGPDRCPFPIAVRAYSRAHPELIAAATAEEADLFYGGTTNGLAAVAELSRRTGVPFGLDLEDFHTGEQEDTARGRLTRTLVNRTENRNLRHAAFLTAASSAIAAAYTAKYDVDPIPIHNVFPLPKQPPKLSSNPSGSLRLYWFSQTIGPNRGLEDAVRAMGLAGIPGTLHLRGWAISDYMEGLRRLAHRTAPQLSIVKHDPAPPDEMVGLCRGYDVGLALEPGHNRNNVLALSNKALTYILAGLAVAFTDTPGQRRLANDLGEGGLVYSSGDIHSFATGLKHWAEDRGALARAKSAAWKAGEQRWHWEHPEERGALLATVARVLGCRKSA